MKKTSTLILFYIILTNINAQTWSALSNGLGVGAETVKTIMVDPNGNIYAGGIFTSPVNYIAKWNAVTSTWDAVGSGVNGPVYSMGYKTASDIYVGGSFSSAGGVSVHNVARWNGSSWSDLDQGFDQPVNCVYVNGAGEIYVGGQFVTRLSDNVQVNHISQYVSGHWITLGSGIPAIVDAITKYNSILYAGCEMVTNPVQKLNPTDSTWSAASGISGGKVYALASYGGYLYAGGDFQQPNQAGAKWDGSHWSSMITAFSFSHKIYSLYVSPGNVLYVGGNFTGVGINTPNYIAKVTSVNAPIQAFTVSSDLTGGDVRAINCLHGKILAGGTFTSPTMKIAITSVGIGIDEINDNILDKSFFPNPVSQNAQLKVTTKERLKNPEIKIYDLQSRLINNLPSGKTENNNEIIFTIDCSTLPSGNYFYQLSDEGQNVLFDQFIKE